MIAMVVVTICQPYAHLICVMGEKRVENRNWSTHYRGVLGIHAGKSKAWMDQDDSDKYPTMAFGALVGLVEIVDCLSREEIETLPAGHVLEWVRSHDHTHGPYCWILANPHKLVTPIPCKGHQGLWRLGDEVLRGQKLVPLGDQ